jgi:hypothetical protein
MKAFEIDIGLMVISDGRWRAQLPPDTNHNQNSPYNFSRGDISERGEEETNKKKKIEEEE